MAALKTTGKRASYGPEIGALLTDYRALVHQPSEREVVRDAIRFFIKAKLEANPGLRKEFEALQTARRAAELSGMRVVTWGSGPSKAAKDEPQGV